MTYRCSRARREFEAQLKQAVREMMPLYRVAIKCGGAHRLLAAYYVFAFSQLEVYVKNFVEDSLATLNETGSKIDKLPDLMLGFLLHKSENLAASYRRFSVNEDEGELLEKVAQTARKICSWSAGAESVAHLDASDFLEKKKYPSPKNIPQLFRRLGVKKIWAVIGKAGRMNGEMILTSLNDLRTDIAHEGRVPPGFTIGDFRDRLDQMCRFVAALDRGVATHFCSATISRTRWNEAMT